jgi:flagellar motor protein MotB
MKIRKTLRDKSIGRDGVPIPKMDEAMECGCREAVKEMWNVWRDGATDSMTLHFTLIVRKQLIIAVTLPHLTGLRIVSRTLSPSLQSRNVPFGEAIDSLLRSAQSSQADDAMREVIEEEAFVFDPKMRCGPLSLKAREQTMRESERGRRHSTDKDSLNVRALNLAT